MSIIFVVLLFSVLIFVHEFGHFAAAKLFGIQVNEFSMFMGPAIAKWKRGETQYSIRCIPIGGYCAMEGEDEDTDNPHSFQKAKWWKRLIVLAAGSFMNLVIGIVIVAIVLFCQPNYATPQIRQIESWSTVSADNGLKAGDTILKFNGQNIRVHEDFTLATMMLQDGKYDIVVERDGDVVVLNDVSMVRQEVTNAQGEKVKLYGISFDVAETTAASVPGRILPTTFNQVKTVIVSLKMLLTGQASWKDMGGVVAVGQAMTEIEAASDNAAYAFLNMLYFGGFIAINLAVMNILPIPALDGGRIIGLTLTTAIEGITKKKINPKYEGYVHAIGMVLLLALMAIITFKDIFNIFKG